MDMIEAYYAVAASLRQQAERMLETAEMLAGAADVMSEKRMREKQPNDSTGEPAK